MWNAEPNWANDPRRFDPAFRHQDEERRRNQLLAEAYFSVARNNEKSLTVILQGVKDEDLFNFIHIFTNDGSLLSNAVKKLYIPSVQVLLEFGASVMHKAPTGESLIESIFNDRPRDYSILSITASNDLLLKQSKMLELLLQHGADVNQLDDSYNCPLLKSVLCACSPYLQRKMMAHGGDPWLEGFKGQTAVGEARKAYKYALNSFEAFESRFEELAPDNETYSPFFCGRSNTDKALRPGNDSRFSIMNDLRPGLTPYFPFEEIKQNGSRGSCLVS